MEGSFEIDFYLLSRAIIYLLFTIVWSTVEIGSMWLIMQREALRAQY